jgi:large subunit ribosomal protein L28
MRRCDITGKIPMTGNEVCRRGLSKKSGGVGIKTTAINPRKFGVNLRSRRLWVPELKKFVRVKISVNGLRTAQKNGIYKTLLKAGVLKK